ncbi:unnamed protein product [Callosobruchus maculatus]|uniref:Uncharacterized protein n=1 Tax=Callosobruchus maculatus TaxID=64391 RepID=A0A653BPT4_CALMS|nr:unnamed protein product [Callosobruchus maculatus]
MEKYLNKQLDSDDTVSEDGTKRRKRGDDTEDEEEVFKKSKKVTRSPQKGRQCEESAKLDKLLEMMSNLSSDVKQIRQEQKEHREVVERLIMENEELRRDNKKIKEENIQMRNEIKELRDNIEIIEKHRRQNNVVMSGREIHTYDQAVLKEEISNFIQTHLKIETKIKATRKLGPKTCLIELEDQQEKMKIMKNKARLKDIKDERIYINHDTTIKERAMEKAMRKIAQEERSKGNDVKVGVRKMFINGIEWKWNGREEKMEKVVLKN